MPFSIDPPPQDNEFECANCGAYFHYSLTRCPACGVSLYEPDLDGETGSATPKISPRRPSGLLWKVTRFFNRLSGRSELADELFGFYQEQMELYQDLLLKAGGDSSVVEGLIDYERKRAPKANRSDLLKRAISRWEDDNRASKA